MAFLRRKRSLNKEWANIISVFKFSLILSSKKIIPYEMFATWNCLQLVTVSRNSVGVIREWFYLCLKCVISFSPFITFFVPTVLSENWLLLRNANLLFLCKGTQLLLQTCFIMERETIIGFAVSYFYLLFSLTKVKSFKAKCKESGRFLSPKIRITFVSNVTPDNWAQWSE